MRLTLHSDLAFRMLIYLGTAGSVGGKIHEIAEVYGVSENHLRKVVAHLTRLGLVTAVRGRGGGLRLAVQPDQLSIGAMMRKLETDFALVECLGVAPDGCIINGCCGLQHIFGEAMDAWFAVLDRYTLADAIGDSRSLAAIFRLDEADRASLS